MLHRVIIAAETVGSTGVSTLSLAQILGVSERNNRRDQITCGLMFLDGWCLHGMEGRRADLDRLLRRLSEDRRLKNVRVVVDKPIQARSFTEPMALCDNPRGMLAAVHLSDLAEVTANHAERMVELKQAA
ncbi:BLUF domain-containing protein [Brevundimonas sp.]